MAKGKSFKDALREKELREKLLETMKQQYQRGLLTGSVAMLKAVSEKAKNTELPAEERISDIEKFCETLLKMTKDTEVGGEKVTGDTKAPETITDLNIPELNEFEEKPAEEEAP